MRDTTTRGRTAAAKKPAVKRGTRGVTRLEPSGEPLQVLKEHEVDAASVQAELMAFVDAPMLSRGDSTGMAADGRSYYDRGEGLTLEEISGLLRKREAAGYDRGRADASNELSRAFSMRLQAERSSSIAGAIEFAVAQVMPSIEALAKVKEGSLPAPQAAALREARDRLVVVTDAMGRQATRIARGDDPVIG